MSTRRSTHANATIEEIHDYNIYLERREIWYHAWLEHDAEDPGVEYRSVNQFIKNLRYLDVKYDNPILIHFNSAGGDWYYGMAAYNAINNCESKVIALLYGPCMSMGSIIPLAADKVVVMPDTTMMIHHGTTDINELMTWKQGQSWAAHEKEKIEARMLEIYGKTCKKGLKFDGKTEGQIRKAIRDKMDKKEDWFLVGQEIVDYGFAHGVFGNEGFESMTQLKDLDIDVEEDVQ
jgi:ATP-dependent protease ClpP protease subunit